MRNIFLIFVLSVFANSSCAQDCSGISSELLLGDCLSGQAQKAEHNLNDAYNNLMKSLPKSSKTKMREAERTWIAWRERECDAQAQFVEDCAVGCGVPDTMKVVCMTKEARARTAKLKSYLNEIGD